MKTSIKLTTISLFFLTFSFHGNAQFFKKLAKKAEKAAERTVERRVESETSKKTDQALDSVLGTGSEKQKAPNTPKTSEVPSKDSEGNENTPSDSDRDSGAGPKTLKVYSKFDYVPGDKQLFFDDFGNEFMGDFPSKWNTNGGGELVTLGESPQKWLELKSGYSLFYIPDVPQLPEDYTIEFDIAAVGLDRQTSSTAKLGIYISDDGNFKRGDNFAYAQIPFCQYSPIGVTIENHINRNREIRSTVKADLRTEILENPHISIAVNKNRYRLWVNEVKYIDVPRFVPSGAILNTIKFHANGFNDEKEKVFISNLKVAEGGVDLRRKLISEGRISTNGILFDSGSANIRPESMGIIRQIYQVLQQDASINLKIVGHTDADGGDEANLSLSKNRADAVKKALVDVYNTDSARLVTEGKGELEPIADNTTPEGKAQNRRVEFIKQ